METKFEPVLKKLENGKKIFCCPTCGKKFPKPKSNIRGRPKPTTDKYLVEITKDGVTKSFKYPSLYQAAEDLTKKGYKKTTRFSLMNCKTGKYNYPDMKVSLIESQIESQIDVI